MNETWTEETAVCPTLTFLESSQKPSEEDETKEIAVIEGEVEEVEPPPFYKRPIPRKWAILLCLCLLIFSTVLSTILIIFFTATATSHNFPHKKAGFFSANPYHSCYPYLSKCNHNAFSNCQATGSGHQDATYATGLVTFYNALPSPQEVPQGQLLIGADGIHIVTDQDAFIPAGTLSVNGQMTISAHVTTLGSQGNIQAGDISGACCRDYVFARKQPIFRRPRCEEFYRCLSNDVDSLTQSLSPKSISRYNKTLLNNYRQQKPLTPPLCSQSIVPTPSVGQEANTVTVNITKTCSAASYTKADLTASVKHQFQQFVAMQFGSSYVPVGNPQVTISNTSVKENNVRITAFVQGTIVYHFRKADMDALKQRVAGKSKEQAGGIILKWHDLQLVGIQLQYNQDSLPSDPEKIKVRVKP